MLTHIGALGGSHNDCDDDGIVTHPRHQSCRIVIKVIAPYTAFAAIVLFFFLS